MDSELLFCVLKMIIQIKNLVSFSFLYTSRRNSENVGRKKNFQVNLCLECDACHVASWKRLPHIARPGFVCFKLFSPRLQKIPFFQTGYVWHLIVSPFHKPVWFNRNPIHTSQCWDFCHREGELFAVPLDYLWSLQLRMKLRRKFKIGCLSIQPSVFCLWLEDLPSKGAHAVLCLPPQNFGNDTNIYQMSDTMKPASLS